MIELTKGKLNILIDGQFGSTGKGLLAEYISSNNKIDIAITTAGPNAGHTFTFNEEKQVAKQLPVSGILNKDSIIYLSQGSVINKKILFSELYRFGISEHRLYIHPQAAVICDDDIEEEQISYSFKNISSTQNGVGAALARKIKREENSIAKQHKTLNMFTTKTMDLIKSFDMNSTVLLELPQGLGLSLNSHFFPYCTSRDITVSNALNDVGLHPYYLGKVIACLRTYPIRVGNLPGSYSGDFYEDSVETSWEELGLAPEYTTNTKRIRRVATFSYKQYTDMLRKLRPDYIFLNFCNYMDYDGLRCMISNLKEVTHMGFGNDITKIITKQFYQKNTDPWI